MPGGGTSDSSGSRLLCSFHWSGHGKRILCCNPAGDNNNKPVDHGTSTSTAVEATAPTLPPHRRALAVRLSLAAVAGLVPWFTLMLIVGLAFKIVDDSYPYFLFFG